jgi:hypothetical protein
MHIPLPARSGAKPSQRLPAWAYALAAFALLGISQLLWLWHSWPVREVLDAEQLTAGTST